MKIRAAVARGDGRLAIEACTLDAPGPGEVRVRVEAVGICHTDLLAASGRFGTPLPAVLGHEGLGRIERLGPGVDGLAVGDRVLMSYGACGTCGACADAAPAYCRHALDFNLFGRRLDGGGPITLGSESITGHFFGQSSFATHAVARARNVVPVGDDLPAEVLCPLACGAQTGAGAVSGVLGVGPGDTLGVFGCGTVGLSGVMAARVAGCARVVAIDRLAPRLELARALGATETICVEGEGLARALAEMKLTAALDTTGHPEVIATAFGALRPRGRMAVAGVSPRRATIAVDLNRLMSSGRSLRGTVEGDADPREAIPRMIGWHRAGRFPIERLTRRYAFEQIDEAVADMAAHRVIKPIVTMPGAPDAGRR